jgi:hypothetical protein
MITFKAKIKDREEWFEGTSLIDTSMGWVLVDGGMEWIDSNEWSDGYSIWEIINIETLIVVM